MGKVRELFFHVSGEHETLPYAEVKAILEAEGLPSRNVVVLPQLLCVEADVKGLSLVAGRSGLTRACGVVLLKCEAEREEVLRAAEEVDYGDLVERGETFSVKIKTIMRPERGVGELESAIGRVILGRLQGVRVDLTDPDVSFLGILSRNVFVLGQKTHEPSRRFLRRKLRDQPFAHPSSMSPKLARVIVNLARVSAGSLVLDPFCGTGSILVEAGLVGCKVLGSEINQEMLRGTMRNLDYFGVSWEGLVTSDARCLPFTGVDCVVTDPPYGRASSTHGVPTREIVSSFLAEALDILPSGGYISIVLPDTLRVGEIVEDLGYICVESHLVREHKSLTREISVIRRP